MSFVAFQGSVELGLIYAIMAMGLFVSFRILDIADLTVDGSFTTGAALSALCTLAGHPFLGLLAAMAGGVGAGLITALLQTQLKIQPILAGILTMTSLYSINLLIMRGSPNLSLLRIKTVFSPFEELAQIGGISLSKILVSVALVVLCTVFLVLFFRTQLGLSIRATGDNEEMVRASSINTNVTKTIGLCLANMLVSLSGGLLAQYQSSSDISMGIGMVVISLASLIIGEVILGRKSVARNLVAVTVGSILYRLILSLVLSANLNPSNLKLISSVIVVVAISYPVVREKWAFHRAVSKLHREGK
ncbi:ABC transporter permease [Oscillospiraceae bacterium MB08-C2-2]|nr:ABC transporter permease [Oscillospiraceae bacterium MB08-C2-2]